MDVIDDLRSLAVEVAPEVSYQAPTLVDCLKTFKPTINFLTNQP